MTIKLDLGAVQPIRGASFNTAAGCAGVEWPAGISVLVSDDGKAFHLAGELVSLDRTDRLVEVQLAGGSGYGDPGGRAPAALADDVADGYVSPEAARTAYRQSAAATLAAD